MESTRLPLFEVAGAPYEMGYQHGAAFKEQIVASLNVLRFEVAANAVLAARPQVPWLERARQMSAGCFAATEAYAPDIVEEMQGIAAGAGLAFDEIFALNSELDILATLMTQALTSGAGDACSSYAVGRPATADGETVVGWNADSYSAWLPSTILIRGRPTDAPPFIFWNFAGCVGRPGMNPYLALAANGLYPSDTTVGVPYCVICRKVLQQTSTADAVKVITQAPRAGGMNYTLGDVAGDLAAVECTARRAVVIPGQRGVVFHTNHYIAGDLLAYEMRKGDASAHSRRGRLARLQQLFAATADQPLTLEQLQAVHRDHKSWPNALCVHERPDFPEALTLAALVMQPQRHRMWAAYGPPCRHEFVEYAL